MSSSDTMTNTNSRDTNLPGQGRLLYKAYQYAGKKIEKVLSRDERIDENSLYVGGGGGRSTSLNPRNRPVRAHTHSLVHPGTPHQDPRATLPQPSPHVGITPRHLPVSTTNTIPQYPSAVQYPSNYMQHTPTVPFPQYHVSMQPYFAGPPTPLQPSHPLQQSPFPMTLSPALSPGFNFDPRSQYQYVPVPTAAFGQGASSSGTTPPIIIVSSRPSTGTTSSTPTRTRNGLQSRAVRQCSRGNKPDPEDPGVLVSSANHRFHAFFDIQEYLLNQGDPITKEKVADIVEKIGFLVKPFNVVRKDGVVEIRRRKDDRLYHEIDEFVDMMDVLVADFIWHYPNFIFELSKRHRKDILYMFETETNSAWINEILEQGRAERQ